MWCCYGFYISKNRKKSTVKPFADITKIHVYENKKRIASVYPDNPTNSTRYDKNGNKIN